MFTCFSLSLIYFLNKLKRLYKLSDPTSIIINRKLEAVTMDSKMATKGDSR